MDDEQWVRNSFLISPKDYENKDEFRQELANFRELSEAEFKFTDTTLGGNFAINAPPQFTRHADLRVPSRFNPGVAGMGRYYSEAIDDNGQYVHMRFGIPEFNSLTNFFFNFYNPQAGSLANRGRGPSAFYYIGKAAGFVVSLPAQPVIWLGAILRFLTKRPASKFYYLKPTMPTYWSAVSNIVNMVGVNMGVIERGMSKGDDILRGSWDKNQSALEGAALRQKLAGAYPNIYRDDGGIDIYVVSTRAQRMAYINRHNIQKAIEDAGSWSALRSKMAAAASSKADLAAAANNMNNNSLEEYVKSFHSVRANENDTSDGDSATAAENHGGFNQNIAGPGNGFTDFLRAELQDGASFVTFRVDNQGSVSESFSNSVGESSIASTLNSTSSQARTTRFSFANGNFGGGALGSAVSSVIDAGLDVAKGVLAGVEMSGLLALAGDAFVDIPKVWESSSANLPTASYTIELRSPYGTPYARFQNLIVPLAMLLAGVLPLATGRQSYTSPFLCELYCKGRQQIRLGMIESMSITRGTGNIGWTREGEPLGIDVNFTVADMSTVLNMPITANYGVADSLITGAASLAGSAVDAAFNTTGTADSAADIASFFEKSTYDDDNAFTDYMSVLGSLGLADQIYPTNKLRLRRAQRMASWEQWKSRAYQSSWLMGTYPGRVAKMILQTTDPLVGANNDFQTAIGNN